MKEIGKENGMRRVGEEVEGSKRIIKKTQRDRIWEHVLVKGLEEG